MSRKDEIIEVAFKEWGKTWFFKTSLSTISDALNISKAALYKHFKNKDEIIKYMRIKFTTDFELIHDDFILKIEKNNFKDIIDIFVVTFTKFFLNNISYMFFFVFHIIKADDFRETEAYKLLKKQYKYIKNELADKSLKGHDVLRFLYSTIMLSIKFKYINNDTSNNSIEEFIKSITKISKKGFSISKNIEDIDFKKIEKLSETNKESYSELDKIYNAIFSVVAKEGFWNTTIEKIAKEMDISKSSLYHYFDHKEEMISKLINIEAELLNKLIEKNINKFQKLEDKIYALIYALCLYFYNNKNVLISLNWLRFQQSEEDFKCNCSEVVFKTDLLEKLVEEKKLNPFFLNKSEMEQFLRHFIVREVISSIEFGLSEKEFKEFIRTIYKTYMFGLKGVNDEK